MNYWWVCQNQTYAQEFEDGYMWSPKTNIKGTQIQPYDNMGKVAPGDIVFSFFDQQIYSIGIIKSKGYDSKSPREPKRDEVGWRVDVEYHELDNNERIRPKDHMDLIWPHLRGQEYYVPLRENGDGNQGYLFKIPPEMAKVLLKEIGSEAQQVIELSIAEKKHDDEDSAQEEIENDTNIPKTEKDQLVKSRCGQGKFRSRVETIENKCRITGISQKQHLIASHIKPWKVSSNLERLDGNNGLLLAPHIDHLFDKGYISFEGNGKILISERLDETNFKIWSIKEGLNVGHFSIEQQAYLAYHRDNIFNKFND